MTPAPSVPPTRYPALAERGYAITYRHDAVNYCPGCGRSQWFMGRSTAECAFCATAIPFATVRPEVELVA